MNGKELKQSEVNTIVTENLRRCYADGLVVASPTKYSDFWARDTFFALPGIIKLDDYDIAKKSIKTFLDYQKKDGQIPRKIIRHHTLIKYVFKKTRMLSKARPVYSGVVAGFDAIDGNSTMLIATEAFLRHTNDIDFINNIYYKLKKSIEWYKPSKRSGFIQEYFLSEWMDTVFKFGPTLYSNVLYCRALKSMSFIASVKGEGKEATLFEKKHHEIRKKINTEFWNGDFFVDELNNKNNVFDSAGNIIACYYDVADEDKKTAIVEKLLELKLNSVLIPTVFPLHSFWKINPISHIFLAADYHNGNSWLWMNILAVSVFNNTGYKDEGNKLKNDIDQIILRDGVIGETYLPNGILYSKTFWKSVYPFAWSAGVYIEIENS